MNVRICSLIMFLCSSSLFSGSTVLELSQQEVLYEGDAPIVSVVHLGDHIIAEFHGCQNLNDIEGLAQALREAAEVSGATVLQIKTHQFEPVGMSGLALLAESHISVHTWPEHGYAAVDMYTCGAHAHPELGIEHLATFFKSTKVRTVKLVRGYDDLID